MRGPQISEKRAYEVLGLKPPVSRKELMTAFRKGALKFHPDRGGDPAKFRECTDAKDYIQQNPYSGRKFTPPQPPPQSSTQSAPKPPPPPVEEDDFEFEFDDSLVGVFWEAVGKRKIPAAQASTVVIILRMLSKFKDKLNIFVYDDEVVIQRKTKNGLWLISIDGFDTVILQVASWSGENLSFYKYADARKVVVRFLDYNPDFSN